MRVALVTITILFLALPLLPGAPDEGWRSLFDGQSLEGWVTRGGRYDGEARWSVEDGCIVGRPGEGGRGGLLYTAGIWRDVEVELDVWMTWPFDSGLFFRMRPKGRGAQVTLDHRQGGEIAGVYSDGWWLHNPEVAPRFQSRRWHRLRARCVGDPMHLTAWLDGALVLDHVLPEAAKGFVEDGRIGLQVHGGRDDPEGSEVRFRRVSARAVPDDAGRHFQPIPEGDGRVRVAEAGRSAGWEALLGEDDLGRFVPEGEPTGYRVEHGVLHLLAHGESPHLATREDYRDFHLKLEFRIAPLANSGVFLRGARDGSNPAFSGAEVQIVDDAGWEGATGTPLRPGQLTGSLYGAVPPGATDAVHPAGEWNRLEIRWKGSRLVTALNGRVLYDVDTHDLEADPPFTGRAPAGFLGLQRHAPAGPVDGDVTASFRNVFVRRLP